MAVSVLAQTLYADLSDLKTRVRPEVLLKCFDWNRDGVIEPETVAEVINAASTDIDAALQTTSGIYPAVFTPPFPPKLRDIALDGMLWRIGAKYPEYYIIDHLALQKHTEGQLSLIRTGKLSLGTPAVEAGSGLQGGSIYPDPGRVMQAGAIFANNRTGRWGGVF